MLSSKSLLIVVLSASSLLTGHVWASPILTHGPVVGGATNSAANVFVRTDQNASVILRYSTDPNFASYQQTAAYSTDLSADFTRIIPLTGLTAEMTYYLNVYVNNVPQFTASPYPSFKTFPVANSARDFKFVVLTDFVTVKKLTQTYQTFASAAAENPAFVFLGGDFDHSNPQTIPDRQSMFKNLYGPTTRYMDGFVNDILRKSPIVHQWDDHDVGLNNADKNYTGLGDAQQVFEEFVPTYPLPAVRPGIWQKFSYAQLECFVLDCRSQRDPSTDPDDASKSMLDGNNLGSPGQLQWLENGLLTSTARWKVIFTSVVTNPTTKFPDGWAGYQTEWSALRDFINSNQIKGVVFISGDLHLSGIDNGTNAGFPEMCVTQPNADRTGFCATATEGHWSEGYYEDECSGYGLVTILQNPDRLVLQDADQYGAYHVTYTVSDQNPTPTPTPTPSPPVITSQPADARAKVGQTAKFSVHADGDRPFHYQWKKNAVDIRGAKKASYTTPPVTQFDNGALFSVQVVNTGGSVTSDPATLTVKGHNQ